MRSKPAMVRPSNPPKTPCVLIILFVVCQPETYKSETGDGPCLPCPKHSVGSEYALTECRCVDGYYRAATDPKNMSCTRKFSHLINNLNLLANHNFRASVGTLEPDCHLRGPVAGCPQLAAARKPRRKNGHRLQGEMRRLRPRTGSIHSVLREYPINFIRNCRVCL